jgi:sulfur carrier protein
VEINGEILTRSAYARHGVQAGDRIEIIHAVGGG